LDESVQENKNKKIFIIEDEFIVSMDFQSRLKERGYNNTFIYNTGKKAIENIILNPPDLVLLDNSRLLNN
jgi:AmiR/NasT family two-component response regulator